MLAIFLEYSIDAAHFLPKVPPGHKCGRMHGHRYDIRIELAGEVGDNGWILDYAEARKRIDPFIEALDHQTLNEIIDNPTCERIVNWLLERIFEVWAEVSLIEVRETSRAGCVWRREARS